MSQNPYEAPQTLASAFTVPVSGDAVEVGSEILQVMRGAKHCYQSVLLFATSLLLMFVLGFILPREIVPLAGWVFLIAILVAVVLHVLGMLRMLRIDPASRARGLFFGSLIATAIVFLGYIAIFVAALKGIAIDLPWMTLATEIVAMIGSLLLLWGLRRVGEYLQAETVIKNSNTALIFFGLLYAVAVICSGLLLIPSIQTSLAEFQRKSTILSSLQPIYFSLVMIATIFYVKALDAIVKRHEKPKFASTVPPVDFRNLMQ